MRTRILWGAVAAGGLVAAFLAGSYSRRGDAPGAGRPEAAIPQLATAPPPAVAVPAPPEPAGLAAPTRSAAPRRRAPAEPRAPQPVEQPAGVPEAPSVPAAAPEAQAAPSPPPAWEDPVWADSPEAVPLPPAPDEEPAGEERAGRIENQSVLEPGLEITVRLLDRVSSRTSRTGESFHALVDRDVVQNGQVVIPAGSEATGSLAGVRDAGRVSGRARIVLELETLEVGGETYDLRVDPVTVEGESEVKEDVARIGTGAAIGAIVGIITGGKKGAAVGATVGAGTGTAGVLTSRGRPLEIARETKLRFRLSQPLSVGVH